MSGGPGTLVSQITDAIVGYNEEAIKSFPKKAKQSVNTIFDILSTYIFLSLILLFSIVFISKVSRNIYFLIGLYVVGILICLISIIFLRSLLKNGFYELTSAINAVVDPYNSAGFENFLNGCTLDSYNLTFTCT